MRVYDRETDAVRTHEPRPSAASSYRRSVFKYRDRWTVLARRASGCASPSVSGPLALRRAGRTLGVPVGGRAPLADVREAVLGLRRGKGMVIDPGDPDSVSAGSFFTNPILSARGVGGAPRRPARLARSRTGGSRPPRPG